RRAGRWSLVSDHTHAGVNPKNDAAAGERAGRAVNRFDFPHGTGCTAVRQAALPAPHEFVTDCMEVYIVSGALRFPELNAAVEFIGPELFATRAIRMIAAELLFGIIHDPLEWGPKARSEAR